ncbi:hypothetical protein V7138_14965 [Bacillus sp. JJ1533]|uniref:hypothetical protein n=1 Tax=Bacillus sp. JJ1533 TaxID=3122959 RepID=UPI0030007BEA
MLDQNQNQDVNNTDQNTNGDQSSTNSQKNENTIPYDRFQKVNTERNELKTKYEELLKQQQQADEEAKKKQGEFESLYTDLKSKHDPLVEQLNQYQEIFKQDFETKLNSVPKEFHDLIPEGSELDKLKWINNAIAKGLFGKKEQKAIGDMTNGDATKNEITKEQFKQMSISEKTKLANENPTLYAKLRG